MLTRSIGHRVWSDPPVGYIARTVRIPVRIVVLRAAMQCARRRQIITSTGQLLKPEPHRLLSAASHVGHRRSDHSPVSRTGVAGVILLENREVENHVWIHAADKTWLTQPLTAPAVSQSQWRSGMCEQLFKHLVGMHFSVNVSVHHAVLDIKSAGQSTGTVGTCWVA